LDKKKTRKIVFYIFYFTVFLGGGIQGSFLNLYLSKAGMDKTLIGYLNGAIQVLCFFVFPLWGKATDGAKYKNNVLIVELALTTLALVAFAIVKEVWMIAVVMVLYSLCHNPSAHIYETITMANVKENGWKYSPIRMTGTIGYAIMAVVTGFWISKKENLLFPIFIGVTVLALIVALFLPKTKGSGISALTKEEKKAKKKESNGVFVMLKNKKVRNVLILCGIYSLTNTFNGTYYGIYMTDLGGAYVFVGIGHMIMALAEVPFHVGPGSRWLKKLGVEKSMVLVMFVGAVRWIVAALSNSPWMLVMIMAFNGIMLVPTIVLLVEFLYDEAPENLKTSASTSLKSPFQLGGMLLGNFLGATLVGLIGIRNVYFICAPVCLIAGALVAVSIAKDERAAKKALAEKNS